MNYSVDHSMMRTVSWKISFTLIQQPELFRNKLVIVRSDLQVLAMTGNGSHRNGADASVLCFRP
jgi:hypothetical protein